MSRGGECEAALRCGRLRALGLGTRNLEAGQRDAEEAIVLIHGGPGSAEDWAELLPRLADLGRAIAFDLPGFGQAEKPADWPGYMASGWASFIAAALSRLGVNRAHLVLSDLGGQAGLNWAVAHREAFASAVLLDTGILLEFRWHLIGRVHRAPLLGQITALAGGIGLRGALALYEPRLPRRVLRRWREDYDWGTRRALVHYYRATPALADRRLSLELREIDRPALVIWGDRDRFVGVEQAARQRASFPSADVIVLKGSGHYPHLDSPDRVAPLARAFLADQLGGAGILPQPQPSPSRIPALPGQEKAPEYEKR